MADTYTTNLYLDYLPSADERLKGRRGVVNTLYRSKCVGRACSGFGLQGFSKSGGPLFGRTTFNRAKPTLPQFSGSISPAEAREVSLCLYDSNTVSPVVLETMPVDASGNFACEGWYRQEPSGHYFFRIAGDINYSTKDFPVLQPVDNEYRKEYGQLPADTSTNLQVLYVSDTFTDAQGTDLDSHTPDVDDVGSGWVISGVGAIKCGSHAEQSRFVAYTVLGATQTAHIETNDADVLINLQIVVGDSTLQDDQHGVIVRFVDANNYLRVVIEDASTTRPTFSLISKVAGVDTVLWSHTFPTDVGPLTLDKYYQLNVLAVDERIIMDFYLGSDWPSTVMGYMRDFKADLQGVTDHLTATKHGLYIGNDGMYADELKIWSV